jgi:hypothetical protein
MVEQILKEINTDNIIPILLSLSLLVVLIVKLYTQIKEAIVKALRVIGVIIGIVCIVGIQQGVFDEWMTKLTTYIK